MHQLLWTTPATLSKMPYLAEKEERPGWLKGQAYHRTLYTQSSRHRGLPLLRSLRPRHLGFPWLTSVLEEAMSPLYTTYIVQNADVAPPKGHTSPKV